VAYHRFHFSFGITREGMLFLLFVVVLSLVAINTGNNLLIVILAVLLSMIAVSGVVSRNSLKQVSISLQLPENVFVGDNVSIKISMKNRNRALPSLSIRVEDSELRRNKPSVSFIRNLFSRKQNKRIDSERAERLVLHQAVYFPILGPGEMRSELIMQSFSHRGIYHLQGVRISTLFPFGFFRRSEHIRINGTILVYPSIQIFSSFSHLLPFLPGWIESRQAGLGEELFSMRKYQNGESARIIDWKATAKTGELMAHEHAREEENRFCLILDTHLDASIGPDYAECFEKGVSLAASIAAHFLKKGAGIEFLTHSEYVPHGTGLDHLYRILRSLAVVQGRPASPAMSAAPWNHCYFPGVAEDRMLLHIFSDKVFKIIITSKAKRNLLSAIERSSHWAFFEEL
jgi:uncharacterized protein (DUF58 family)